MAEQFNTKNLTHRGWPKGKSGNPSGRPSVPRTLITIALRERLGTPDPNDPRGRTVAEQIADALILCALDPDPELDKTRLVAINEISNRCEGKPVQQVELNDITAQLRQRSDEDLLFHVDHGYWPEEEFEQQRNKKILEAKAQLNDVKTDITQ